MFYFRTKDSRKESLGNPALLTVDPCVKADSLALSSGRGEPLTAPFYFISLKSLSTKSVDQTVSARAGHWRARANTP